MDFKSSFLFIRQVLLSPGSMGAILPSSNQLAQKMLFHSNILNANTCIELGCGTGVMTKKIKEIIKPESIFFAIELNAELVKVTKNLCPDVIVHNGCASDITKYMGIHDKVNCDTIISGLPFASFSHKLQCEIIEKVVLSLQTNGEFITYTYVFANLLPSGLRFRKLLEKYFTVVNITKIVWKNIPPAYIYRCVK